MFSSAFLRSKITISERELIALLALVQFVNIVDFMMVMPLGPDFSHVLGIAHSSLGLVAGSYTLAAMLAGLLGALFLDRFDRRPALLLTMTGLGMATLSAAWVDSAAELYAMRFLAGGFGGPAAALVLVIVADRVPVARRGRALAQVMVAFTLATVLGVPVGLELARIGDWRTPFLAVGTVSLAVAIWLYIRLPPMREHLLEVNVQTRLAHLQRVFLRRDHLLAYGLIMLTLSSGFLLIPQLSTFAQYNLGYPRETLGWLYLMGGAASFVSLQIAGRVVDARGPLPVFLVGSILLLGVLTALAPASGWSATALIAGFMVANSFRVVAINTLTSQVPHAAERAGFMALDSVAHHAAITLASAVSAWVLGTTGTGALVGMEHLAWGVAALILATAPLTGWLWQRVSARRGV